MIKARYLMIDLACVPGFESDFGNIFSGIG